ncbi:MAG: PAS domain S-box protein [Candidatus Heimdallarchaeota archaeon]|nr:PAS domain S-box protein [Candidatus Heimdallarchaeota archaeon]
MSIWKIGKFNINLIEKEMLKRSTITLFSFFILYLINYIVNNEFFYYPLILFILLLGYNKEEHYLLIPIISTIIYVLNELVLINLLELHVHIILTCFIILLLYVNHRASEQHIEKNIGQMDRILNEISAVSNVGIIQRDISKLSKWVEAKVDEGPDALREVVYDPVKQLEIFDLNPIVSVNKSVLELFEVNSKEELIKYDKSQIMAPEDLLSSLLRLGDKDGLERESYIITAKGNRKDVLIRSAYPSDRKELLITSMIDITKYKQALEKISESEEMFKQVFTHAPMGQVLHKNWQIVQVNDSYLKIYGYNTPDELIGKDLKSLIPDNELKSQIAVDRMRKKGEGPRIYETRALTKDGRIIPILVQAIIVVLNGEEHTLSFVEDITEKKRFEEHLFGAHKFESLGLLAGGILHDFNNIMQILNSGLEVLSYSDLDDDSLELINELKETNKRASTITNQLLAYTGTTKSLIKSDKISIRNLIFALDKLISVMLLSFENVDLLNFRNRVPSNSGLEISLNHFNQIMINLITNAAESIKHDDGYIELNISEFDYSSDQMDITYNPSIISKNNIQRMKYLKVEIADNGIGIQEEKLRSVFDPFYTTKEDGKGLGLSVVQGLVFQHSGFIEIHSEIDRGTSISIYLPLTEVDDEYDLEQEAITTIEIQPQDHTLLVVEDEEFYRSLLVNQLRKSGFEVLEAENGLKALEIFKEMKDVIDLVILDLIMPVMGGKEFLKEINKLIVGTPVLISSGYSKDLLAEFSHSSIDFIQKPYEYSSLLGKLEKLL